MERNLLLAILGKYKHLGTEYIPQTGATLITNNQSRRVGHLR